MHADGSATGNSWVLEKSVNTVEPLNKGHFGNNIISAVVSFVERLSSSRRFKMYENYMETNYLGL